VDSAGNLYLADFCGNRIRKVTASSGIITTVAGNGTVGFSGDGGPATAAQINSPTGLAVDGTGKIYIADSSNGVVRRINAGTISTFAGTGNYGFSGDGGPANAAQIGSPAGVTTDGAGNVFI